MKTAERIALVVFIALMALAFVGVVVSLVAGDWDTTIICGVTTVVFAGAASVALVSGRRG